MTRVLKMYMRIIMLGPMFVRDEVRMTVEELENAVRREDVRRREEWILV